MLSTSEAPVEIGTTNIGAVLDGAKPETAIERADSKATARNRNLRTRGVKPAAKETKVAKAPKQQLKPSETVAQIAAACDTLKIDVSKFGAGSFVLRLPSWPEFKTKLPATGALAEVKLFHSLRDAVSALTGDAKATWVFHKTGSFAVYSKMAK